METKARVNSQHDEQESSDAMPLRGRAAPLWIAGQSGNPAGRPRKRIPPIALSTIERFAAAGFSERAIYEALDISAHTWISRKRDDPAVRAALDAGRRIALIAGK